MRFPLATFEVNWLGHAAFLDVLTRKQCDHQPLVRQLQQCALIAACPVGARTWADLSCACTPWCCCVPSTARLGKLLTLISPPPAGLLGDNTPTAPPCIITPACVDCAHLYLVCGWCLDCLQLARLQDSQTRLLQKAPTTSLLELAAVTRSNANRAFRGML